MTILDRLSIEQCLQLVFGQADSLAWLSLSSEGQVVDWSPGAQKMFGWVPEEIVGKSISILFTPDDLANGYPDKELDQAKASGRASDTRWHLKKDGSRVFVDGMLMALRQADGSLAGFTKIVNDASGTIALRESEATLRAMINATPHMVWSAGSDGRGIYFNDRMLEFTGRPLDALLDRGWADLVHPEDRAAALQAWSSSLETGTAVSMEFRFRHHTGEYRWVLCRGEPVVDQASQQIVRWMGTNTDIHDRRVAHDELRDARQRLEATLSAGDIGTWNYDLGSNLVYADKNMAQLFGIVFKDEPGVPSELFFTAIHPDDRADVQACIYRTIETGSPFEASFRVLLPDGQVRYVHSRGELERDADHGPLWFPGVATDVTRLRLSQEELRTREERYRTLLDSIDEGFAIIELMFDGQGALVDHRYVEANRAVARITGLPDIVGKLSSALFPDYSPAWREMYLQVLRTGQPAQRTVEVAQWGRWIEFSVSRMGDGTANQLAIFLRDITERKRQLEDLQRREERYRALFNSIDEGFAVIELEFDARGKAIDYRFLEVNPALERLTGLHDVIGRTLHEVVSQPNLEWVARYGEVVRTGEAVHISDYSEALGAWYDISVVRLGDANTRQAALMFADVSERRKHDEALRDLAAELARANLRQHEFLATLAHELRNPLAPIRASLDVMRLMPPGSPAALNARDIMRRQVDHLTHLVDDLLDLARVTSGKIELKKAPVPLADVVMRAIEATAPLFHARHHDFDYQIDPEPIWLDVDANRLVQVIGNLLTNAAKYTPEHGVITLYAKREDEEAVVSIVDNGIGIALEAQAGLFDMFSQAHAGSELAHGGLGIGLNLVKRLTEKHGGSVQVFSCGEGSGATFTLRIPIFHHGPRTDDPIGATQAFTAQAPHPLRILVVDDNVDAADMIGQILEIDGHEVRMAYEAKAALDEAKAFHPDLALIDIGMPGMNGFDLARAMREDPELAHTKLIALTGWGTEQDRQKSREAGFDAHLTKPVSIEALHAQLAKLFHRPG